MNNPPRRLPWVGDDPARVIHNDIGTFVAQPVGDGFGTSGLHIYAHLAGEPEALGGQISFGARIQEDGSIVWERRQPSCVLSEGGWKNVLLEDGSWGDSFITPSPHTEALLPVMRKIAEDWVHRDIGHTLMHLMAEAERELRDIHHAFRPHKEGVESLTKWLANPDEPKTEYRPDPADGVRRPFPATPEEKTARRADWERLLQRDRAALVILHARHDARKAQLTKIAHRIREAFQVVSREERNARYAALFPFPSITSCTGES